MSIPHLENLYNKPEKALEILQQIQKSDFVATEKFDGFFCTVQVSDKKLQFRTKSKTFNCANDFNCEILAFSELKRYFIELSKIDFSHDFIIEGEAIPNSSFNTIRYDSSKIDNGVFVVLRAEGFDNTIKKELSRSFIRFIDVPKIDIQSVCVTKEICVITNEIKTHGDVLRKPARTEEAKLEKLASHQVIQKALLKAKHKVLDTIVCYYQPLLGNDFEGVVAKFDDDLTIKFVDKEKFTSKNKDNWALLKRFEELKNAKYYSEADGANKELVLKNKEDLSRLDQELAASSIDGTILEQTKIARNAATDKINRYCDAISVTPGAALKTVNSIVDKTSVETLLKEAVKLIDVQEYCLVGNTDKAFSGDIDIAVSEEELSERFGTGELFWESLEGFLKTLDMEYRIIKGLRQFHIAFPNNVGREPGTLKPIENGIIQIDFLVGDLNWMKTILSSPKESKYKAATRNVFLKALCEAKNLTGEEGSTEYSINYRDGLWFKVFDLKQPEGRQKNIQKELVHKFMMLNDPVIELQRFLFEAHVPDNTIKEYTFEYWFESFVNKFDRAFQKNALLLFKDLCLKNHIEFPKEAEVMLEANKTIALFPGSFKPFHKGHFEIINRLSKEADEVVVLASVSDRDSFSGLQAYNWITTSCIPYLPKNARVEFTNKPILYAYKLAHLNTNKGGKTLMFIDRREYVSNKKSSIFEIRTSERLFDVSGTEFRKAIENKELDVIKERFLFNNKQRLENLFEKSISESVRAEYSLLVANIEAMSNHETRKKSM